MATTTAPPPVGRIDHHELRRFLNALRLQLWWRDALVLLAAASLVSAFLFVLLGAPWLTGVCALLLVAAVVLRRPSLVRAARVADRQLQTESRLATAAEVLDGRLGGTLAPAQLEDAWRMASALSTWRAFPRTWRRVQIAALAVAASLAVMALTATGVVTPVDVPGLLGLQPVADETAEPDVAAPPDDASALLADAASRPEAQNMDDLQAQAERSQAAQAALQRLGDALRSTAAAGDVGDALRAGNYDDAMAKLNALATQSDQLSRQSKRELGAALERSAIDSAKVDPPLAVAEDRVARALNRNVYADTRTAMQDLAKAVDDARNGVISQEELARELAQLQQTDKQTPGGGGGDIGESEVGYIPDIPGEAPNQAGIVQGVNSTISVPGPEGDPRTSKRSSVGQEAGGDPFGDLTSRLDVSANDVSVQAQVGADQGRSGLKANPAAPVVKISDATQNNVTPSDVAQTSEPVQAATERDVEPGDQRSAVRSFFKPDTTAPTP